MVHYIGRTRVTNRRREINQTNTHTHTHTHTHQRPCERIHMHTHIYICSGDGLLTNLSHYTDLESPIDLELRTIRQPPEVIFCIGEGLFRTLVFSHIH